MTREVAVVTPETSLAKAVRLLSDRGISGLPVVDAEGRLVGMLTEGDLIRWHDGFRDKQGHWLELLAEGQDLASDFLQAILDENRKVKSAMTQGAITVPEDMPASEVAKLMHERDIKRVPVVRDGRIVGIVTRADLVRALAQSLEQAQAARAAKG
jgi:CBS domain-containing protein